MDLQTELRVFISTQAPAYAPLVNTVFTGVPEEVVLRLDPSDAVPVRYMDGTIAGLQTFSLLAKSKNQATARNYLDTARWSLDLSAMQQLTGALFGKISAVATPTFVSKSDASEYVYSASFELEYFTE